MISNRIVEKREIRNVNSIIRIDISGGWPGDKLIRRTGFFTANFSSIFPIRQRQNVRGGVPSTGLF